MGYSYETATGRLCCDVCGHAGGCRRVKCPAGWCPAVAMCERCRKDPEVKAKNAAYHVESDCAGSSARFAAEQAAVAALTEAGEYVFCASVYEDRTQETVRCWFRGASGETKEVVVSKEVRDGLTRTSTYDDVAGYTGVFVGGVKVAEYRKVVS